MNPKHIQDPLNSANGVSTVEALLAVSEIVNSRIAFSTAVERIERVVVDAGLCTGLVVLEKRGNASLPLAGRGGPVYRSSADTICSRYVRLASSDVQVMLLARAGQGRKLQVVADFVAEQIASLAERDLLLKRRSEVKGASRDPVRKTG